MPSTLNYANKGTCSIYNKKNLYLFLILYFNVKIGILASKQCQCMESLLKSTNENLERCTLYQIEDDNSLTIVMTVRLASILPASLHRHQTEKYM